MTLLALALQVWAFAFVAFFGGSWLLFQPELRLATQLLFGLPLAALAVWRLRGPRDALDLAVAVAVLAHLLVALVARDRIGGVEATGLALAWAVLFWLMRDFGALPRPRTLLAIAAVFALVIWLGATAVAWGAEAAGRILAGGGWAQPGSHQVFIWGTANVFPFLVLLAVGFLGWVPAGGLRTVLAILLLAAAVVVVPLSEGRAGWVGLLAAAAALEPIFGWPLGRRLVGWARWRLPPWSPFAAVGTAGAVLFAVGIVFTRLGRVLAANLEARQRLWDQALGIVSAQPVFGSGPTSFPWARLEHIPDFTERVGALAAHNVPLQALADGGLLLGLGLGLVALTWTLTVWRRRGALTGAQRLSVAVMAGVAVASLADDFSFLPAVTALTVTLAAWAVPYPPQPRPLRLGGWPLPVLAVAVLLVTLPAVIGVGLARLDAAAGRQAALGGNWTVAQQRFESATDRYDTNAGHWLNLALARTYTDDTHGAVHAYGRARDLTPGDARPWGALAELATDSEQRIALLTEAARRANVPQYPWRLAAELQASARGEEAAPFAAIAVVYESPLYGQLEAIGVERVGVRAQLPDAVNMVGGFAGAERRVTLWDAGLHDDALPPDAPPQWTAVAAAVRGQFAAAHEELRIARATEPHNSRTYLAAMAVARVECDRSAYLEAEEAAAGGIPGRRGHGPVQRRDPVHRDFGLGDYQPPTTLRMPDTAPWPETLVELPDCGWGGDGS